VVVPDDGGRLNPSRWAGAGKAGSNPTRAPVGAIPPGPSSARRAGAWPTRAGATAQPTRTPANPRKSDRPANPQPVGGMPVPCRARPRHGPACRPVPCPPVSGAARRARPCRAGVGGACGGRGHTSCAPPNTALQRTGWIGAICALGSGNVAFPIGHGRPRSRQLTRPPLDGGKRAVPSRMPVGSSGIAVVNRLGVFGNCRGKHLFFNLVFSHHKAMREIGFETDRTWNVEELFCSS
jgi:hypothetical protein